MGLVLYRSERISDKLCLGFKVSFPMEIKGKTSCPKKVCVTAAGGFIGSSLVKYLLQAGYIVHATCRDPENPAKIGHLLSLPGAQERLHLFRADLFQQGSFDSAIQGCDFLINLATSLDLTKNPEMGVIQPTIDGTLAILRACKKAKTVRRVIHTSSITAAFPLNENGELKDCLDESCWTPIHYIRKEKPPYWMYYVAKTLAEQAAFQYGADNEMEVVTVLVAHVSGPSLTPTCPHSVLTTLMPLSGNRERLEILITYQSLLGSIPLVHVEDVCNAHIFLMDNPFAAGRYVCCSDALSVADMADYFRKHHQVHECFEDLKKDEGKACVPVSSNKLTQLGFSYKYGIKDIIDHSIQYAKQMQVFEKKL